MELLDDQLELSGLSPSPSLQPSGLRSARRRRRMQQLEVAANDDDDDDDDSLSLSSSFPITQTYSQPDLGVSATPLLSLTQEYLSPVASSSVDEHSENDGDDENGANQDDFGRTRRTSLGLALSPIRLSSNSSSSPLVPRSPPPPARQVPLRKSRRQASAVAQTKLWLSSHPAEVGDDAKAWQHAVNPRPRQRRRQQVDDDTDSDLQPSPSAAAASLESDSGSSQPPPIAVRPQLSEQQMREDALDHLWGQVVGGRGASGKRTPRARSRGIRQARGEHSDENRSLFPKSGGGGSSSSHERIRATYSKRTALAERDTNLRFTPREFLARGDTTSDSDTSDHEKASPVAKRRATRRRKRSTSRSEQVRQPVVKEHKQLQRLKRYFEEIDNTGLDELFVIE